MLKSIEQFQYGLFSPKSFQAATITSRIFDMELSKVVRIECSHNTPVHTLDIDKVDERYLLSGGHKGSICIHDLQNNNGKHAYTPKAVCKVKSGSSYTHKFSIATVEWFPFDTGLFITSGMDTYLKIWDTNSMRPADTISLDYKAFCHNMSPVSTQHSLIAVALGCPQVVLIDPKVGSRCHELRGHKGSVSSVRWSPTCEYLLASGGTDNKIFFWDIRSAKGYLQTLDMHNGEAIGSKKDIKTAHNGTVVSVKFTDDGLYLVSYGTDHRVRLWDVALCKNTFVNFGFLNDKSRMATRSIDLCSDSSLPILFLPINNSIYVFDLFSGCKIKTLTGHFTTVTSCVYRSSTHQLFSSGMDMNILTWTPDVEKEELEASYRKQLKENHPHELCPDPDSDNWSSDEG